MQDPHIYLIVGVCGLLFHMLAQFRSNRTDAEKANVSLSFAKYLSMDWPGHVAALLPIVIWFFTFAEATEKYPALHGYVRISFAFVGALGSWIFQKLLSSSKKWIRTVVDKKTDIADASDK